MSLGWRSVSVLLLAGVSSIWEAAGYRRVAVTPVEKVIQLLTKLRIQVQDEGAKEAASYDKFACFCKEQSNNKVYVIKKSDEQIEKLQASVEELGGAIAQLDSDVTDQKVALGSEQAGAGEAQTTETARVEEYVAKRANLTEGVDAIGRAIESLQASKGAVEASLIATASKLNTLGFSVPSLALLAQKRIAKPGTPASYKYQSNDVIAVLQELLKTFKSELARCEEEGSAAKHDFNMVEGARANKVKAIQKDIDEKEKLSAYKSEQKSEAEGVLNEETTARGKDQAFLDELTETCETKASSWDERSKARAAELTAMTEAIGILDGMGGAYDVNKKLVGLATISRTPSFLQVQGRSLAKSLVRLLLKRAKALDSGVLATLAEQVRLGDDHFVKVRGIIKDLIARLQSEASEEATQKSFCDEKMGEAVDKRDKQSTAIESHSAEIETRTSTIATLTGELTELDKEIAGLHKALNEMIELRASEKASNEKTIADATSGSEAVKQAIQALENFYGADAGALVQMTRKFEPEGGDREGNTVSDLAPETASGEYTGKVGESKGIFGLLQVIASDFDRTVSTTGDAEAKAESDFETQKATTEGEIETKKETKSTKEAEKETATTERTGFEDDRKDAQTLHADALESLDKLKASCVDSGESWEERKKKREQEIDALKQALQILEDWQ